MTRIRPVILAGGSGTRLWPLSRDSMPKQFLSLVGDTSTFQQALLRVRDPALFAPPVIMTNDAFRFFCRQQAAELNIDTEIVLEPIRRDSAAAIAAAAAFAQQSDPQALVLVLSSDHAVLDTELFAEACRRGAEAAAQGRIVTIGIEPTEPNTGYGYISPGRLMAPDVHDVDAFVEKPDEARAAAYIAKGYLWNSGNFLFRADVLMAELEQFEPGIAAAAKASVAQARHDLGFVRLDPEAFAAAPAKSIDYAVMEHTARASVVRGRFRWSDVGSWNSVYQITPADAEGNVVVGRGVVTNSRASLVFSDGRMVAADGLDHMIVVATRDAVLVLPRSQSERVKTIVEQLKSQGFAESTTHHRVYRPWGYYESLDSGDGFQVKRLVVWPGAKLSLQKHAHRAEHWIVVKGSAEITIGDDVKTLAANQSAYIPLGSVHRLTNPAEAPLELIEVQTGDYLDEDDIVRFDDIYRRT